MESDTVEEMGVSQNYGCHFGIPIIRTIVFWDLYWGTLILGNYQIDRQVEVFGGDLISRVLDL